MAFVNTPSEGTPFYRGVAPEVPVPDNTAAKIISAGTATGVSAFVNMALAAERNKLAQQEMLQRADLQARNLEFQREEMQDRHGLAVRGQDIQRHNIDLDYFMQDRRLQMEEDMAPSKKKYLERLTDSAGSALARNVAFAQQTADLLDSAGKDAEDLKLFDPKYQAEHPMEYAKNAYAFEARWGAATEPRLKATIKGFIDKAEESKVSLRDASGNLQKYSWAQVVRDIALKQDESPFVQQLQESGFMETTRDGKNVTTAPKPELRQKLKEAQAADFPSLLKEKSRVAPFGAKNATEAIARGTLDLGVQPRPTSTKSGQLSPAADLPPPEKSQAELEADFVRSKMASDPANAEFYQQQFVSRNPGSENLIQ